MPHAHKRKIRINFGFYSATFGKELNARPERLFSLKRLPQKYNFAWRLILLRELLGAPANHKVPASIKRLLFATKLKLRRHFPKYLKNGADLFALLPPFFLSETPDHHSTTAVCCCINGGKEHTFHRSGCDKVYRFHTLKGIIPWDCLH